jgi:hypothetical protein
MRKLLFLFLLMAGACKVMQAQITWSFNPVSPATIPSGLATNLPANITSTTAIALVQGITSSPVVPFFPTTATAITPVSTGYAGASGTFSGTANAKIGVYTTTSTYIQVVLTPATNNWINVTAINWGNLSTTTTGPITFSIFSSTNNFVTPVATATAISNSTWALINSTLITPITGFTSTALTLRIYASGGSGTQPTVPNWRIDDLKITATAQVGESANAIPKFLTATTFTSSVMTENNGKIGVGTATPTEKLDVVGNLRFSGALMPNGDAGTTTTALYLKSAGANASPVWAPIAGGGGGLTAITASNIAGQQTWTITNPTTTTANIALSLTSAAIGLGNVTNESKATMFTSPTFTGTPVFPAASIPNTALANNSITIGTTNIALGGTATSLAGLASVTSTTFNGALSGNATSATNIAGGVAGAIPYQTGVGVTGMSAVGTSGYVLTSGGAGAPMWKAATDLPSNAWSLDGNTNATATSFLGTPAGTDIDLVFKRNGELSGKINRALALTTFGANAGFSNTTGIHNTFLGTVSGAFNTTGQKNTAIGVESLYSNIGGNNNTALGANTLRSNTNGSRNLAVGYDALYGNTTGTDNIGIGIGAGTGITSGIYNLILGTSSAPTLTTGNYNTLIGSNITGLSPTLSNNIILADGQGNRRINVNELGNVGIGTTAPAEKLDVMGSVYANDKIFIGTRGDGTLANPALTTTQLGGGHKLFVNGSAIFTKAVVRLTGTWPDYVFEPTNKLPTLAEVEAYIAKHKHLEGVPSASEVKEKGIDLGDNQTILLKKVEELTLYMIELNKKVEVLAKENEALKKKVNGGNK